MTTPSLSRCNQAKGVSKGSLPFMGALVRYVPGFRARIRTPPIRCSKRGRCDPTCQRAGSEQPIPTKASMPHPVDLRTMVSKNALLNTALATLKRPTPDRVELHFKAGQRITLVGILEIFSQLDRYNWVAPRQWLVVFPDEPVNFDFAAMMNDHLDGRPANQGSHLLAIAVGAPSNM